MGISPRPPVGSGLESPRAWTLGDNSSWPEGRLRSNELGNSRILLDKGKAYK